MQPDPEFVQWQSWFRSIAERVERTHAEYLDGKSPTDYARFVQAEREYGAALLAYNSFMEHYQSEH